MKRILTNLYSRAWVKVTFLLLLMILTKKLSKSTNNGFIIGCLECLREISMGLIIMMFIIFIIKKPETK
jgi:hypothetical protein